jgi:hypothetical protein
MVQKVRLALSPLPSSRRVKRNTSVMLASLTLMSENLRPHESVLAKHMTMTRKHHA